MNKRTLISIIALVIVSGGCNTFTVSTKIHPDGSFEKTIVCEGDSLGIVKLPLPFTFTDGWKIDRVKKTDNNAQYVTTAVKSFASSDEMAAELTKAADSSKLRLTSRIEKHFRWFFTYYTYEESIRAFGRFTQAIRFDSAFTPGEIDRLKAGKDTVLNKRFDEYWEGNIITEFIDAVEAASQRLNDPAFSSARWRERRQRLADTLTEHSKGFSNVDEIIPVIDAIFSTTTAGQLDHDIDSSLSAVMAKLTVENTLDAGYANKVTMPGIVIISNSEKVEGSTLSWNCRPHRCFDVVMTAESRMINLWAIIGTAIVCIAMLAGLVLPLLFGKFRN